MISTNKGHLRVEGTNSEIMADLSVIIHGIHEDLSNEIGQEKSKERIMKAVEDGFKTDKEIMSNVDALVKKFLKDLLEGLGE